MLRIIAGHDDKKSTGMLTKLWLFMHTKRCPQCGVHVQKVDGCSHMKCVCLYEYCWDCGKVGGFPLLMIRMC